MSKPLPEHVRAMDVRRMRVAVVEIRRATCPPEEKQDTAADCKKYEQIRAGIVD